MAASTFVQIVTKLKKFSNHNPMKNFTSTPQMSIIERFLKHDELENFKKNYLEAKDKQGRQFYEPTKADIKMYDHYLKHGHALSYYAKELGVTNTTVVNRFFLIASARLRNNA